MCDEMTLFAGPWGFGLPDVQCPVSAWHGQDDGAVPLAAVRALAASRPQLQLHVRPGGHLFAVDAGEAVLSSLVAQLDARTASLNSAERRDSMLRL